MSLLRFFLSYNRIPLILFSLFGFFFNLFYNTNILGVQENIQSMKKLDAFDKHGHFSRGWFYNTMTLANCGMGISMAVFHTMAMSSILFNAKYRVVSVLVHFLRIRNIICPLITIFCEVFLFSGQSTNLNNLQSKLLHQSNAQLLPTIIYGLSAIMLYSIYDRYLMEIRLIFDYLTLSLRCTRGLSPLEEQTYICEAINLHACRETMVLEQREKMDRDLKEMLRREKDRIRKEQIERSKHEKQRLRNINYVNNIIPQMIYFIRTVLGLNKITIDEDNIPPSIRTGIEKQKDELRICAAKTMCCSIQKNFKNKNSILPNCLQGISRGKINLCDIKEKDLCNRACGQAANNLNSADTCNISSKNTSLNTSLNNTSSGRNPSPSRLNSLNSFFGIGKKSGEDNCVEECRQEEAKKKKTDACDLKGAEKCDKKKFVDQKKKPEKEDEELDENNDAVSIFNDLPRTDLVMSCEIKRVLDPDCQEVLRCKEVIVPPPISAADKAKAASCKKATGGMSPVGAPFGTATNCNQMGMAQRLQPMYQCANNVIKTGDRGASCSTTCSSSCSTCPSSMSTNQNQCGIQNRGRQMDGMYSSLPSVTPTMGGQSCCEMQRTQNKCDNTCARMMNGGMGPGVGMNTTALMNRMNKTSVQAIPVQVTMTEPNCNFPGAYNGAQMGFSQSRGNSFSNAGAATPLEAQTISETMLMGDSNRRGRFGNFDRNRSVSQCRNKACLNANCSGVRRDGRLQARSSSPGFRGSPTMTGNLNFSTPTGSNFITPKSHTWQFGRSSSMGPTTFGDQCCVIEESPSYLKNKNQFWNRSSSVGANNRCCGPMKTPQSDTSMFMFNNDDKSIRDRLNVLREMCSGCKSSSIKQSSCGVKGCSGASTDMIQCGPKSCSIGNSCGLNKNNCGGLRGGAEEPETEAAKEAPTKDSIPIAVIRSVSPSTAASSATNNKLTETKREVFKTVTNIDDPSGKVIRKECDKVIEEILHSSAQPGESKTMREVTVEKNIIQEANKTIREESHNTREEIINYEMDNLLNSLDSDFENRKQRIEYLRRLGGSTNRARHVSEERHIFGRCKGSPEAGEVQEAAVRSRVDVHNQEKSAGGLKGGSPTEKRGQSEASAKDTTPPQEKNSPSRSQSANTVSREKSFEKGDYCRDFNSRLEASPYGEKIRELKDKLFTLKSQQEMNQTLEKIVCLQTEALMSFIPKQKEAEKSKTPEPKTENCNFSPDLSYSALMNELKSAMKTNRDSVSVSKTISDMDKLNAEIERDMKAKMGAQSYAKESAKDYPTHFAFANLIRDLREKTKDYDDGVFSVRSDEDCETTEQRRQRIEVLRDELEKRKRMLGLDGNVDKNQQPSCSHEKSNNQTKTLPCGIQKPHNRPAPAPKTVTIREPHDCKATEPKSPGCKSPCDSHQRKESGHSQSKHKDDIHCVPPKQELLKCSKEACKKKKSNLKHSVAFQDQLERMSEMSGLPEKTNVKQIAHSLGHLLEMMSKARQSKTPKISMTIKPRKSNLSQDSCVTAVSAHTEALRMKSPSKHYQVPVGKLLGGSVSQSSMCPKGDRLKMPKTPSHMKLHKSRVQEQMAQKKLAGVVKQIKCTPVPPRPASEKPSTIKVDQKTNDAILAYIRARGQSIRTPSSLLWGSHSTLHK